MNVKYPIKSITYNILILLGILFSTANNNSHQTSRKGQPQLNLGQPLLRTVALFGFKLARTQQRRTSTTQHIIKEGQSYICHLYAQSIYKSQINHQGQPLLCTVDLYEGSPQWIHGPLRK